MFCMECGQGNQEGLRYCVSCGAPLMQPDGTMPPPMAAPAQTTPASAWSQAQPVQAVPSTTQTQAQPTYAGTRTAWGSTGWGQGGEFEIPRGPQVTGSSQGVTQVSVGGQTVSVPRQPVASQHQTSPLAGASSQAGYGNLPTIAAEAPRSASTPQITLVRERGGTSYVITEFPATVGKGTAAHVRIDGNSAISRVHALVNHTGSEFVIEDRNSTNGTYINGNVLRPGELVRLQNGDLVTLANEGFRVKIR